MSGWQTTQLTTIFVSAVESSRDSGRPIYFGHHSRQRHKSHTRCPWVARSLRPAATNPCKKGKDDIRESRSRSRNDPPRADLIRGQGMWPKCVWRSKYTAVSCSARRQYRNALSDGCIELGDEVVARDGGVESGLHGDWLWRGPFQPYATATLLPWLPRLHDRRR